MTFQLPAARETCELTRTTGQAHTQKSVSCESINPLGKHRGELVDGTKVIIRFHNSFLPEYRRTLGPAEGSGIHENSPLFRP